MKSFVKVAARLIGVAFGLAVALFLFSSVAFGHSYGGHSTGCDSHRYSYHQRYDCYRRYNVRCDRSREVRYNTHKCGNGHGTVTLSYHR